MKSDKSQCLRGNESKLLGKSLHWSFESFCNKFLNIDKLFN